MENYDRDLCLKCNPIEVLPKPDGKDGSIGVEWATCKGCKRRFIRFAEAEPLIQVFS